MSSHIVTFEDDEDEEERPLELLKGPRRNEGTKREPEPEAEPFPVDCLPGAVADMARAIGETVNVPDSLSGPAVLGILSVSLGAGLQLNSGAGRRTRGNLYVMIGAESGSGKSETFRHAARPFQDFARKVREQWEGESLPALLTREASLKARMDYLKKQFKSGEPEQLAANDAELESLVNELREVESRLKARPKLWTQDVTSQALPVLMAGQPGETLSSLSADAREVCDIISGKWNRGKADDSFYVQSWSGDAYEGDRVGRAELSLASPCLSALWLVQPDKLETMFAQQGLKESGFLPRILVCQSECEPQPIDRNRQGILESVSQAYTERIESLLEVFRMAEEPFTVNPDTDAREALDEHFNGLVERRKGELRNVNSFAARWTEQAWRIGLCLHASEHGEEADNHSLSAETARNAITIADWFSREQLAILSAGRLQEERDKRQAVFGLLADSPGGILPRDVQRARIERTANLAAELLEAMREEGRLKTLERERGKFPLYMKA